MTTVIDGIEVAFEPMEDDYRKTGISVRVHSKKRKHLMAYKQIDPGTLGDSKAVMNIVGVAAGAGAEYLNKRYGDNIDPSTAAKLAIRVLGEESKLQAECGKGYPLKLARVRANVLPLKLNEYEMELLDRLEWRSAKGLTTPMEVAKVDSWIMQIHQGML